MPLKFLLFLRLIEKKLKRDYMVKLNSMHVILIPLKFWTILVFLKRLNFSIIFKKNLFVILEIIVA